VAEAFALTQDIFVGFRPQAMLEIKFDLRVQHRSRGDSKLPTTDLHS